MKQGLIVVYVLLGLFTGLAVTSDRKHAIRGVWLTNVDSQVLNSTEGIAKAVDHCASLGFNTIFVVTWNKAMTTYPSRIMKSITGMAIDTQLNGRDPLKELIETAHRKNIKVVAWFEFGFSSSYNQGGGTLLHGVGSLARMYQHSDPKEREFYEDIYNFVKGTYRPKSF